VLVFWNDAHGICLAIRNRIMMDASQNAAIWIDNHPLLFSDKSVLQFYSQKTLLTA